MLLRHDSFRRLCQARDLLHEIHEREVSIEEVARAVGISPFHFIRQFESLFGLTPHQFRIRSRLDRARLLLGAGTHSVTEVCMEVGFSSLGSFSALFARRVGVPPSVYQRRVRSLVAVPGTVPPVMIPGCFSLMAQLPRSAFSQFSRSAGGALLPHSNAVVQVLARRNANQAHEHHGR